MAPQKPRITLVQNCVKCGRIYKVSSRHKACPKCRKLADKHPCPLCGNPKQRKSKTCFACFRQSKQFPYSKKKHIDKSGYIYVYFKTHPYADREGRIFEHRLIMEKKLGRYLYPFENVHHINGMRADNRIENLELWINKQPTGSRAEDVVKWAREILEVYGGVSSIG